MGAYAVIIFGSLQLLGALLLIRYGIRRVSALIIFYLFNTSYFSAGSLFYIIERSLFDAEAIKYLIIVNIFFPCVALGAFSAKGRAGHLISKHFYSIMVRIPTNYTRRFSTVTAVVGLVAFLFGLTYFSNGIPILSSSPELARFQAIRGNLLEFLVLTYISPFLIVISIVGASGSLAMLSSVIMAIITMLTGFRSPLVRISLFWVSYISSRKALPFFVLLILGLVILLMLVLLTHLKFPEQPLSFALMRTFSRIFLFSTHDAYFITKSFPANYGHWYGGALLMDAQALAPGYSVSFDGWVYERVYGSVGATNSGGLALWADFGWFFLAPSYLIGFFIGSVDRIYEDFNLSDIERAVLAFIIVPIGSLGAAVYGKFFSFLLPILLVVIGLRVVVQILSYAMNKRM